MKQAQPGHRSVWKRDTLAKRVTYKSLKEIGRSSNVYNAVWRISDDRHTGTHAFGRFQNLNLLVLREDLRRGDVAQGDWSSLGTLCPLAHGLSAGRLVGELRRLSQAINLEEACCAAAKCLGVLPIDVYHFVREWDDSGRLGVARLAQRLDELWAERLADADCVQEILASRQVAELECVER